MKDFLVVIPARSGSKGLKNKNTKLFNGKPLIAWTVEEAKKVFHKNDICISTDSEDIAKLVYDETGVKVPFLRPNNLSDDHASSRDFMLHAIEHYESKGFSYKWIVMLQCTSPLRNEKHIKEALTLVEDDLDMLISVYETDSNPYYLHRLISEDNRLIPLFNNSFKRRQDCPKVYELNGAVYVIKVDSIKFLEINDFQNIKPYIMDKRSSIDIDDEIDFKIAEFIEKELN